MHLVRLLTACLALGVLGGCGSNPSNPPTPLPVTPTNPLPVNGFVSISGTQFIRNGVSWVPHGLNVVAFVPSPSVRTGLFGVAYNNFTVDEVAAMKAWGADTLRFQVSQPALDSGDPSLYDPNFLAEVVSGVKQARAIGLNVIVSVQDESGTGEKSPTSLPNAGTGRAWQSLATALKGDNGIMFEILNEPELSATATNWALWATATNSMIVIIRNSGATNVLIADGLNFAEHLDGAPTLSDPLQQVAYASHPYAHSAMDQQSSGPSGWDSKFGNVSVTALAPVLVTEWSLENTPTPPNQGFQYCDGNSPEAALAFLGYLQGKGIGLLAFSYDLPNQPHVPRDGRVMIDSNGTPSTLANQVQCTDPKFGPGSIIQGWYKTEIVPSSLL